MPDNPNNLTPTPEQPLKIASDGTVKVGPGKAYAAMISGAVCTIFFWAWSSFLPGHLMPPEVQGAFQTLAMVLAIWKVPHTFGQA